MNKIILLLLPFLASCTYSITMVHTEGYADDVVDQTATNKTDVSPDINVSPTGL